MRKYFSLGIFIPLIIAILAIFKADYFFHIGVPVSCILVLILIPERSLKPLIWIVILSLIFCIAGDWMLAHQNGNPNRFIYGVFLFLAAHIGYLIFCLKKGKMNLPVLFILLLVYGSFFIVFLYPVIDNKLLLIATLLYLIFSCFTMTAAIGLEFKLLSKTLFVAGIACFLFSDTLIALNVFLDKKDLYVLMMPTYYMSHVLITAGLIDKQVFIKNHH